MSILAVIVSAVLLGIAHTKAELGLTKVLGPTEDETKIDHTSLRSRNLLRCNPGEILDCGTTSCKAKEIQGCGLVNCDKFNACGDAIIKDSSVICSSSYSCDGAFFYRSIVKCQGGDLDHPCASAQFQACAVFCKEWLSCTQSTGDDCTFTYDGTWNPPSYDEASEELKEFCAKEAVPGITCAGLGNPFCQAMPGYNTVTEAPTSPPTETPASPATETPASPATETPASSTTETEERSTPNGQTNATVALSISLGIALGIALYCTIHFCPVRKTNEGQEDTVQPENLPQFSYDEYVVQVGSLVELIGLSSKEYNGSRAVVEDGNVDTDGHVKVKLVGNKNTENLIVLVKPDNFRSIEEN